MNLVVYAITPVQGFITNARKLRDYWTGSVILSYLSFWGIKTVCEKLGADAIAYPSLKNQSLVAVWAKGDDKYKDFLTPDFDPVKTAEIASFPNKFVFKCDTEKVEEICKEIDKSIQKKWIEIGDLVKNYISTKTNASETFSSLWSNQIETFWKFSYGSCKMLAKSDEKDFAEFLSSDKFSEELKNSKSADSILYGTTHSLAQGILAAGKMKPTQLKNIQNGMKCPLCGEHEVLHDFGKTGETSTKDYSDSVNKFWEKIRNVTNLEDDFIQTGEKEKLCAVCSIKRYLPMILSKKDDSILHSVFKGYKSFPSTTEIAFSKKIQNHPKKEEIIKELHKDELSFEEAELFHGIENLTDRDKYYAFVLMDGDKMGDLINGETLSNPVSEETHKKVSDALNDFARGTENQKGVKQFIDETGGRLIYAGGDDVCAIVPLDKALDAEFEISKAYKKAFENLGLKEKEGKEVSISGSITLAHHKTPLKEIIKEAHPLLDEVAKNGQGRNALAIRLKKRSGGKRDFAFKWNAKNEYDENLLVLDSFKNVVKAVEDGKIGQSLLYKIESLREIFRTVLLSENKPEEQKEKLFNLLEYEVSHSGKWSKDSKETEIEECTKNLFGICLFPSKSNCKIENGKVIDNGKWFSPEAAIIACFMADPDKMKK